MSKKVSLLLVILILATRSNPLKVKVKRQYGQFIGNANFHISTDKFANFEGTTQFCNLLNSTCHRPIKGECSTCRCRKNEDTFISYNVGCQSSDYFKENLLMYQEPNSDKGPYIIPT
eukprot:TCONS_00025095-protein